ncbi:pyridoxamine 5'-phosphate oxidase family protein [Mumia quercus]|uniref:pyridoxamine 5'-phosphate oxidase family protein n=1 Tax=Mumia quercus TaxID=2976125 RepID=UPI0021D13ECB|nr:pyridoxamine 5'-phosphate oxidase family protein [Mumia quercus]
MRWSDLVSRQPRLADAARRRLLDPGVVLLASVRRDGTPRVSPVEPFVLGDDLLLSMLWGSTKAKDVSHDPRILVHSIVTGPEGTDGELKLRGRAVPVDDRDVQSRYAEAVGEALGWRPQPGRFHLFRVDVEHVAFVRWDSSANDQLVTTWPPGKEYVRRGTSATSVGPREPYTELLVAE